MLWRSVHHCKLSSDSLSLEIKSRPDCPATLRNLSQASWVVNAVSCWIQSGWWSAFTCLCVCQFKYILYEYHVFVCDCRNCTEESFSLHSNLLQGDQTTPSASTQSSQPKLPKVQWRACSGWMHSDIPARDAVMAWVVFCVCVGQILQAFLPVQTLTSSSKASVL